MDRLKDMVAGSRKAIVSMVCALLVPFAVRYGVDADAVAQVVTAVVSAVLVWLVPNGKVDDNG